MKAVAWVDYRNGKRIVALVGAAPRPGRRNGAPSVDIISIRFQKGPRWTKDDQGVYMTPDEAATAVMVLGEALAQVTQPLRAVLARKVKS